MHSVAEVCLNGRDLGVLWCAPWQVDVTNLLKPTGNELEIDVINVWANRIIGDAALPEEKTSDLDLGNRRTERPQADPQTVAVGPARSGYVASGRVEVGSGAGFPGFAFCRFHRTECGNTRRFFYPDAEPMRIAEVLCFVSRLSWSRRDPATGGVTARAARGRRRFRRGNSWKDRLDTGMRRLPPRESPCWGRLPRRNHRGPDRRDRDRQASLGGRTRRGERPGWREAWAEGLALRERLPRRRRTTDSVGCSARPRSSSGGADRQRLELVGQRSRVADFRRVRNSPPRSRSE